MYKRLLVLLFLLLVACQETPEPIPERIPELVTGDYKSYIPVLPAFNNCPTSEKAGLAWSHSELGWPKGLLCYREDAFYHNWLAVGGQTPYGLKISMVWSDEKNGYPYFDKWVLWKRSVELAESKAYSGFVMWGNEPDRPDQASMTITETAELFLALARECPKCKFIGPGYSSSDNGTKVRQVWDKVSELCPDPCLELNSRYGNNPHHFPIPLNWTPNTRLDKFCDIVYGDPSDSVLTQCGHPNWPTIGWRTCYGSPIPTFTNWIRQLEARADVERYFFFTTFQDKETGCQFDWATDLINGKWVRRPLGDAFVAGLR